MSADSDPRASVVLDLVARHPGELGRGMCAHVLYGSSGPVVEERGFRRDARFGALRAIGHAAIRDVIAELLELDVLRLTDGSKLVVGELSDEDLHAALREAEHAFPPPAVAALTMAELGELARDVAATLQAPEVGRALDVAGCADPKPSAGKRTRLRAAIIATQERDGHAGALARLHEAAASALEERTRRYELMGNVSGVPNFRARARVPVGAGEILEVGVVYLTSNRPVFALRTPTGDLISLNDDAARELMKGADEVRGEIERRTASQDFRLSA